MSPTFQSFWDWNSEMPYTLQASERANRQFWFQSRDRFMASWGHFFCSRGRKEGRGHTRGEGKGHPANDCHSNAQNFEYWGIEHAKTGTGLTWKKLDLAAIRRQQQRRENNIKTQRRQIKGIESMTPKHEICLNGSRETTPSRAQPIWPQFSRKILVGGQSRNLTVQRAKPSRKMSTVRWTDAMLRDY